MRKKHGTIRTAVRPSGSMNRDRFGWFRLFQPLNDVVQLLLFFSPIQRHSEMAPAYFFPPLYGVVLPFLKITLLKPFLISQSLSTLTRLCLSQKSLSNPHILKSQSLPRTVALSQLSLFVTLSLLPLSRVAVAAQPRLQLPRRRRSSAQV